MALTAGWGWIVNVASDSELFLLFDAEAEVLFWEDIALNDQ